MPEGPGGRLVAEAFHCRLKGPVQVDKKTLVELQGFQAVSVRGVPGVHQAPGVSGGRMLGRPPHPHRGGLGEWPPLVRARTRVPRPPSCTRRVSGAQGGPAGVVSPSVPSAPGT